MTSAVPNSAPRYVAAGSIERPGVQLLFDVGLLERTRGKAVQQLAGLDAEVLVRVWRHGPRVLGRRSRLDQPKQVL